MKKILLLAAVLIAFVPLTSHAFALSFKYVMCTVEDKVLREEVSGLKRKWGHTQRRYSPSSQYRKHIGMHVEEAVSAIDDAMVQSDCSPDRKSLLKSLQDELLLKQ